MKSLLDQKVLVLKGSIKRRFIKNKQCKLAKNINISCLTMKYEDYIQSNVDS